MPVKIRLMRIGAKKRPFYRVVAVDERRKRTGQYLELLGTYNPLTEPKEINLKQDLIDKWIKQGAVMSTGFLRIIGKNPQKPPRKPKKAPAEPKPAAPAPTEEAPAAEEAVTETSEAPVEETPIAGDAEEGSTGASAESEATEDVPGETGAAGPAEEPESTEEPAAEEEKA